MSAPQRPQDRAQRERLFLEHLAWIERTLAHMAQRAGFRDEDAEDAAAFVRTRLIEDDYGVLGRFRGGSRLTTYLVTVMANLVRDYRVHLWGRWRPSASARRAGDVAVRLERLIHRDGLSRDEAVQTLLSRGDVHIEEGDLRRLVASLPDRDRADRVALDVETLPAGDDPAEAAVIGPLVDRVRSALTAAISELPDEETVIIQLHFFEGLGRSDVARALGLEVKPFYRRFNRILVDLRERLEERGIDAETARAVVDSGGRGWF